MEESNDRRRHDSRDWDSEESESLGEGGDHGWDSDLDVDSDSEEEEERRHREEDSEEDGPRLDGDTLLRIKQDDPAVTSVDVRNFHHCIDEKDAGYYIGLNSQLKKLSVKGEFMGWDEEFLMTTCQLGRFAKGMAENRSIKELMMRCCDFSLSNVSVSNPKIQRLQKYTAVRLAHFCERNVNLESIKLDCCDLGDKTIRVLAMVLGRKADKGSLRRMHLTTNDIGDAAGRELIESLKGYGNLAELNLGGNSLGVEACAAIKDLVTSPACCLRELNLQNNDINDEGIVVLTEAFSQNTILKDVDLSLNSDVTPSGWLRFSACLRSPSSSIELLDLSHNDIRDEVMGALGAALANNVTLRSIHFSSKVTRRHPVSASGWRSFFDSLRSSKSALQDLILRGCSIDEDGLIVIAEALNEDTRFKILDLSNNPQANAAAWRQFFAACFRSSSSSLEGIFLCENFAYEEEANDLMADLVGALERNETLEAIDLGENLSITEAGWSHFTKLLCDESSINSMYESNHALNYLGPQELPPELEALVDLNRREDKGEVAREKILRHHFRDDNANMQEFLGMRAEVLPLAISWLGRGCSCTDRKNDGHSHLYQLLRSMPSLFPSKHRAQATGAKRKREA
mmetsp:Transcript_36330/g.77482  ORF Transcript_36330/g.77482 Transcript_36330/m.77482 type:complete len:628 (+) Transcript_36330:205-2088(+)